MTNARADRRRRILQDGATAAPRATGQDAPGTKVRYTPRPGSASFAVAAGVVPRSIGSLLGVLFAATAVIAGLAWADGLGVAIATADTNRDAARLLMVDRPASLASWWTAGVWLAVAAQCVLIYGLRRHRTDDLRGGYRGWLAVAVVAIGMSVCAATHAHVLAASALTTLTGFDPLGGGAFWSLVVGVLVLGTATLVSFFEVKESVFATLVGTLAVGVALVGGLIGAGLAPGVVAEAAPWLVTPLTPPIAQMAAAVLALISLLVYSRRIVLEAEGAIAPPAEKVAPAKSEATAKKASSPAKPKIAAATKSKEEPKPTRQRTKQAPKPAAASQPETTSSEWVDGGEGYSDDYDEGPQRRRLSKAERKRLRKLKARRAA